MFSKDRIPKALTCGVVYKFQYGLCNESYYSECETLEFRNWWYISTCQLLMRDQLALPLLTDKIKFLQLKCTKRLKVNEAPITEIFTLSNKKTQLFCFRFIFEVSQGTKFIPNLGPNIWYIFSNGCKFLV